MTNNYANLRNGIFGATAAITMGLLAGQTGIAQCVSGMGATPARLANQTWPGAVPAQDVVFTTLPASQQPVITVQPISIAVGDNTLYMVDGSTNIIFNAEERNFADGQAGTFFNPSINRYQLPFKPAKVFYVGGHLWILFSEGFLLDTAVFQAVPGADQTSTPAVITNNLVRFNGEKLLGAVFDGQYAWFSGASGAIYKVNPYSGSAKSAVVDVVNLQTTGAMSFDGREIWVGTSRGLVPFDPLTKGVGPAVSSGLSGTITAITYDGVFLWVSSTGGVEKVDPVKRQGVEQVFTGSYNNVLFDGTLAWGYSNTSTSASRVRGCDGAAFGAAVLPAVPMQAVFDGQWMITIYKGNNTVSVR